MPTLFLMAALSIVRELILRRRQSTSGERQSDRLLLCIRCMSSYSTYRDNNPGGMADVSSRARGFALIHRGVWLKKEAKE